MAADNAEDLILDILIHDINNANTIALGYASILESKLTGEDLMFLESLASGVQQSAGLIKNAQTIRKVQKSSPDLVKISLANAMKSAGTGMSGIAIEVSGDVGMVLADEYLDELFRVILENVKKHAGKDAKIAIRVAEKGDYYEVSVEDTGPGISDILKEGIFNRLDRNAQKKSRKGLGLVLARLIVDRYGGTIRAEDRVPGKQGEGAAIRFTLKKAPN